jgi:hypothetical protein
MIVLYIIQMEDILIPMLRGNMEDIEGAGGEGESLEGSASTANTQQIYEREDR